MAKDNWWNEVNEFVKSADNERIVRFKFSKKPDIKFSISQK